MHRRCILSSASNAFKQHAVRVSASRANTVAATAVLARPGPSRFPGCLDSDHHNQPHTVSPDTLLEFDFLYPSLSASSNSFLAAARPSFGSRSRVSQRLRYQSTTASVHANAEPSKTVSSRQTDKSEPPSQPERQPTGTPAGHPSQHKLPKAALSLIGKVDEKGDGIRDAPQLFPDTSFKAVLRPDAAEADEDGPADVSSSATISRLAEARRLLRQWQPIAACQLFRDVLKILERTPTKCSADTEGKGRNRGHTIEVKATSCVTPHVSDLVAMAEQLLIQLASFNDGFSTSAAIGFSSEAHCTAAWGLWKHMRRLRLPRTTTSQSALVKALLRANLVSKAAVVYEREARVWWSAFNLTESVPDMARDHPNRLLVELSRPSGATLREVQRSLSRLQASLEKETAEGTRDESGLRWRREEYGKALLSLCRLLQCGMIPVPPATNRLEVVWLVSACCRVDKALGLERRQSAAVTHGTVLGSLPLGAQGTLLESISKRIRACMRAFIRQFPGPEEDVDAVVHDDPHRGSVATSWRSALTLPVYNQLIQYCLEVLRSPRLCRIVFLQLTKEGSETLRPDDVTFNIILRQATTKHFGALSRAVLLSLAARGSGASKPAEQAPRERFSGQFRIAEDGTPVGVASRQEPPRRAAGTNNLMLSRIDDAILRADSYRLSALVQYVASSGVFLQRYRRDPGHVDVKELVMRIYPRLAQARAKSKSLHRRLWDEAGQSAAWRQSTGSLRPRIGWRGRFAIYDPHVLTAVLKLTTRAGKTGLSLRIWRLIKHLSRQSQVRKGEVSKRPWSIPVEAATIFFDMLSREGRKSVKVLGSRRSSLVHRSRVVGQLDFLARARRYLTKGWNMDHSRSATTLDRWKAARVVARTEYALLLERWNLAEPIRMARWTDTSVAQILALSSNANGWTLPDERFYDALLDLFGRRPGMRGRSPQYRSRSDSIHRAKRAEQELARKRALLQCAEERDKGHAATNSPTTTDGDSTHSPRWNLNGRWTAIAADPFLLLLLKDMRALGMSVPLAFRGLLSVEVNATEFGPNASLSAEAKSTPPTWASSGRFRNTRLRRSRKAVTATQKTTKSKETQGSSSAEAENPSRKERGCEAKGGGPRRQV